MRMVAGRGEGKIPLSVQVEGGVSEHRACEAKVSSRCGQRENGEASQAQRLTPVTSELRKLRQEGHRFETILGQRRLNQTEKNDEAKLRIPAFSEFVQRLYSCPVWCPRI